VCSLLLGLRRTRSPSSNGVRVSGDGDNRCELYFLSKRGCFRAWRVPEDPTIRCRPCLWLDRSPTKHDPRARISKVWKLEHGRELSALPKHDPPTRRPGGAPRPDRFPVRTQIIRQPRRLVSSEWRPGTKMISRSVHTECSKARTPRGAYQARLHTVSARAPAHQTARSRTRRVMRRRRHADNAIHTRERQCREPRTEDHMTLSTTHVVTARLRLPPVTKDRTVTRISWTISVFSAVPTTALEAHRASL
jgi:hypothetical protein